MNWLHGTPTTVNPRGPYSSCSASSWLYCGVSPHRLATFTTQAGLPPGSAPGGGGSARRGGLAAGERAEGGRLALQGGDGLVEQIGHAAASAVGGPFIPGSFEAAE